MYIGMYIGIHEDPEHRATQPFIRAVDLSRYVYLHTLTAGNSVVVARPIEQTRRLGIVVKTRTVMQYIVA